MLIIFDGLIQRFEKGSVETERSTRVIASNNGIPTVNDAIGCVLAFFKEYKENMVINEDVELYVNWFENPFITVEKDAKIAVINNGKYDTGYFTLVPDNYILTVDISEDPKEGTDDGQEVNKEPTSEEE